MNSAQAAVSTQFQDSVELEEGIRLSQSPDFIIPYEGASYADLIETLLVNQFMYDEVVKEVKHYKNENSRLRGLLEFNGKNTRSRKSDAAVPEVLLPHVDAINILGKKFAVMVYPWLKASAFVNLTGRPAIISHGSLRYRNAENIELALTADLYDNVPSVFHHLMQCEPKFGDMFRSAAGSIRSTQAHTLRKSAALIFELKAEYFLPGFDRKCIREIADLLGFDTTSQKYTLWCPVLYPRGSIDGQYVFRNPALPKLLKMVFFGPSSLSTERKPTPHTNAMKWGLTAVTDGAIAFAAIMAKFLLSTDKEFVETGAQTAIPYNEDFWDYRRFLANMTEEYHSQLLAWYNERVFGNSAPFVRSKRRDLTDATLAINRAGDHEDGFKRIFSKGKCFPRPQSDLHPPPLTSVCHTTSGELRYNVEGPPFSASHSPSQSPMQSPLQSSLFSTWPTPDQLYTQDRSIFVHPSRSFQAMGDGNPQNIDTSLAAPYAANSNGHRGRRNVQQSYGPNTKDGSLNNARSLKKVRGESVAATSSVLEEDTASIKMEVVTGFMI